ncbi:MAG: hypothetical protein WBA39_12560 [Rivularia sp. (in: cyanobacteria)]
MKARSDGFNLPQRWYKRHLCKLSKSKFANIIQELLTIIKTREEGRRKKEEGRRNKEEGTRKKEEGTRKNCNGDLNKGRNSSTV